MKKSCFKNFTTLAVLFFFFTTAQAEAPTEKGLNLGVISIHFPTPGEIQQQLSQCTFTNPVEAVDFPVMCQQLGSAIFKQGRNKITKIGLRAIVSSSLDPFGLLGDNDNIKKRILFGTGLMIGGASMIATCPPIPVESDFHQLSSSEKLQRAQALGYRPAPIPPLFRDVDNPADPASCTSTVDLAIDPATGKVTDFGDFMERDLAYTSPFGSYPSATSDAIHLTSEYTDCLGSLLQLVQFDVNESINVGLVNAPQLPDVPLDSLLNGLLDLIIETIGLDNFETVALNSFNGWKTSYRADHPAYCDNNSCEFEHGDNRLTFFIDAPASLWGSVTPSIQYFQDLSVMEYFDPEITALPLTIHLEALEIGGVTVKAYPPRSWEGNPPDDHHYTFDQSWLGIQDNCEANPTVDFPIAEFYPLGSWQVPITVTDRVGNTTTDFVTLVVEDSIPPDLSPPEPVGIPVPDGTTSINFTDPGIGCVEYLCQGFSATHYLYPPAYFDFASISPDVECYVENSLYSEPTACSVAQLPVNEGSLITWRISDPSGNPTEATQPVFVREESANTPPVANDAFFIVGNLNPVDIPLSANDPDYDTLEFSIVDAPANGTVAARTEPIFQTRFTTSGLFRNASGIVHFVLASENDSGEGVLVAVPDEQRIYSFKGDFSPGSVPQLINRYELNTITPSAMAVTDGKNIQLSSGTLYQLLKASGSEPGVWLGDWQQGKIYRYTNNGAINNPIVEEKFVINLPSGLADPVGLAVRRISTTPRQYGIYVVDKASSDLWQITVNCDQCGGNITNDTYTLVSAQVIASGLPTTVSAIDLTDNNHLLVASWDNNSLQELNLLTTPASLVRQWDLSPLLTDPDGPDNPALPIIQNPRDLAFLLAPANVGTPYYVLLFFDQAEQKVVNKRFYLSSGDITCGSSGSPDPNNPPYCLDPEADVIRLPALVDILAIEEHNGLIYVLGNRVNTTQYLFRFDLFGRLDAIISLFDSASSPLPLPPSSGGSINDQFVDMTIHDNGWVFLLEGGASGFNPYLQLVNMSTGVDQYTQDDVPTNCSNDQAIAVDVNASDITAVLCGTELRIITGDLTDPSATLSTQSVSLSQTYNDVAIADDGTIYLSNRAQNVIDRYDSNGNALSSFNDGLDFFSDPRYGRLYYDNQLDRLWVTDFAEIFYPDLGQNGETHRMPRVSAFDTGGILRERLIPNGDPNDFFSFLEPGDFGTVTSMATSNDRFYVAEKEPFHRLHVFDTSPFVPITCDDQPEGESCRQVGYEPESGYTGPVDFTFAARDPFEAVSNSGQISLQVINDTQAPTITCPDPISVEANTNGGFLANLDNPEEEPNDAMRDFLLGATASDNTTLPEVVPEHDLPEVIPLGTTLVTWSGTDGSGDTGQCTTMVTVTDQTAPVISDPQDITREATAELTPLADIGLSDPSVTDYSPYVLSSDAPTAFPLGETRITWHAEDLSGNSSEKTQLVTVVDTTPPEFTDNGIFADLTGTNITRPVSYTPPQATDLVGLSDDVACVPAIGDPVPMGPVLIQCSASDTSGNKANLSLKLTYMDDDDDGDGIINVLDQGANTFDDSTNGGTTTGAVLTPGDYQLQVYEGPTEDTGVVVGITSTSAQTNPAQVSACSGKIVLPNLNRETLMFDDIAAEVPDYAVLTCTPLEDRVYSKLGDNDVQILMPDNSLITSVLPFNNGLRTKAWFIGALDDNTQQITLTGPNGRYHLEPGTWVDLRQSPNDDIFRSGFE